MRSKYVVLLVAILAGLTVTLVYASDRRAQAQQDTVAEMRAVGMAIFEFITDEAGAAAAGKSIQTPWPPEEWDPKHYPTGRRTVFEMEGFLAVEPDPDRGIVRYIDAVPRLDGWNRSYHYHLEDQNLLGSEVASIFSCGEPTKAGDCKRAKKVTTGEFPSYCYSSDLVWADGTFVSYPTRVIDGGRDLLVPLKKCDPGVG